MNHRISVSTTLALGAAAGVLLTHSVPRAQAQAVASPQTQGKLVPPAQAPSVQAQIDRMQAQIDALQVEVKRLKATQGPAMPGWPKITPLPTHPAPEQFAAPKLSPDLKSQMVPASPYRLYVQPSPQGLGPALNAAPTQPHRYTNIPPTRIIQLELTDAPGQSSATQEPVR